MKVSCLLGHPVEHSVSPTLFNEFAKKKNLEYSHIKIDVDPKEKDSLKNALLSIKYLNFVGLNITLPYKTDVIPFLDKLDKSVEIIGAVNTIVNKDGYLKGYNTDAYGAIKTIENNLKEVEKNDKVLILGAGGAARAVLFEISKRTSNITVFNRGEKRLNQLKKDFLNSNICFDTFLLSNSQKLEEKLSEANFIINCTSVGMNPNDNENLIPISILNEVNSEAPIQKKFFFDVIFNPYKTKLLKTVEDNFGAKVVGGMQMMIYQGTKAFELWTGEKVNEIDVKTVENKLLKALDEKH